MNHSVSSASDWDEQIHPIRTRRVSQKRGARTSQPPRSTSIGAFSTISNSSRDSQQIRLGKRKEKLENAAETEFDQLDFRASLHGNGRDRAQHISAASTSQNSSARTSFTSSRSTQNFDSGPSSENLPTGNSLKDLLANVDLDAALRLVQTVQAQTTADAAALRMATAAVAPARNRVTSISTFDVDGAAEDRAALSPGARTFEEQISRVHLNLSPGTVRRSRDCAQYISSRYTPVCAAVENGLRIPNYLSAARALKTIHPNLIKSAHEPPHREIQQPEPEPETESELGPILTALDRQSHQSEPQPSVAPIAVNHFRGTVSRKFERVRARRRAADSADRDSATEFSETSDFTRIKKPRTRRIFDAIRDFPLDPIPLNRREPKFSNPAVKKVGKFPHQISSSESEEFEIYTPKVFDFTETEFEISLETIQKMRSSLTRALPELEKPIPPRFTAADTPSHVISGRTQYEKLARGISALSENLRLMATEISRLNSKFDFTQSRASAAITSVQSIEYHVTLLGNSAVRSIEDDVFRLRLQFKSNFRLLQLSGRITEGIARPLLWTAASVLSPILWISYPFSWLKYLQ